MSACVVVPVPVWGMGDIHLRTFVAVQIAVVSAEPKEKSVLVSLRDDFGPASPWTQFEQVGIAEVAGTSTRETADALTDLEARGFLDLSPCGRHLRLRLPSDGQGQYSIDLAAATGCVRIAGVLGGWIADQQEDHMSGRWERGPAAPKALEPGFVYVMTTNPASGPYKVGRSSDTERRRRQLQNASTDELQILRVWDVEDMPTSERAMHDELDVHRVHGEFFACTMEAIDEAAAAMGLRAV